MGEQPHAEFWKDLKPVAKVFREGGLPEIYASRIAEGDERYWVPISETVSSKPVWISPSRNMWADVLMSKSAGLVNRHYHPHPIWAYTISGKWAYFVYETPGESHTLVCYDHADPMKVFFVVSGPLMWLDEDGNTTGHYDVYDYIAAARAHYAAVGIGADYVDTLIR
jgi:2,4'-dihydroxyacetophenone dioxygenase